jgi:hypothetical protein
VTVQQKDARKDKPTGTGMSLTFTANCPILGYWYRTQAKAWWSTYPNPSSSPWVTSSEAFIYC